MYPNYPPPHHTQISNNKRIIFIDGLRGFSMLLVIYIHIFLFLTPTYSEINKILVKFRMPLFFFISGFFMYSYNYSVELLKRRTQNRLIKQLLPTITFFIIYVLLSGISFNQGLASPNKAGYWFTFVSVEIYLILAPILCFSSIYIRNRRQQVMLLMLLGIISYGVKCILSHYKELHPLITYLDINYIVVYLPYVLLGCIVKMLWEDYEHQIIKLQYFCVAIIVFGISYISDFYIRDLILGICGIYAMFYLFYCIPKSFFSSKIGKLLTLIGTSTLEIYLLHYFFFGIINKLHITEILSPLLDTANNILEFPSYLLISVLIAVSCLLVVRVMKSMKIYQVFFPDHNSFLWIKNSLCYVKKQYIRKNIN